MSYFGPVVGWNDRVTPQGPTPAELVDFDQANSALWGSYAYINIRQNKKLNPRYFVNKSRKFISATYGMTWIQLRQILKDELNDKSRDMSLLEKIKLFMLRIVPVRSGRLLDTMLNFAKVERAWAKGTSRGVTAFSTEWTPRRPKPIGGTVSHVPPAVGWGEPYNPKHNIPNRVIDHYPTRGRTKGSKPKGVYYRLNDPQSVNDPMPTILDEAQRILMDDYNNRFDGMVITLKL